MQSGRGSAGADGGNDMLRSIRNVALCVMVTAMSQGTSATDLASTEWNCGWSMFDHQCGTLSTPGCTFENAYDWEECYDPSLWCEQMENACEYYCGEFGDALCYNGPGMDVWESTPCEGFDQCGPSYECVCVPIPGQNQAGFVVPGNR